jgi:hypothetical protein
VNVDHQPRRAKGTEKEEEVGGGAHEEDGAARASDEVQEGAEVAAVLHEASLRLVSDVLRATLQLCKAW